MSLRCRGENGEAGSARQAFMLAGAKINLESKSQTDALALPQAARFRGSEGAAGENERDF